jgi:hypothetical protein
LVGLAPVVWFFQYASSTNNWTIWGFGWPVFPAALGIEMIAAAWGSPEKRGTRKTGMWLTAISVAAIGVLSFFYGDLSLGILMSSVFVAFLLLLGLLRWGEQKG